MTYYHCHVRDGRYQVCATTNGLDHMPIPTGVFGKPRDAIRYAAMRAADVQPIRLSGEDPGLVPPQWSGVLTRAAEGQLARSHRRE
jgi:hypothetical protein